MTAHAPVFPSGSRRDSRRSRGPVTAEDRELSRPDWQIESPLLLTRAQAAQPRQVSEEILDQRSYEPGFPVIRHSGGHFVRIHRTPLERWLEQFALASKPRRLRRDDPPQRLGEYCRRPIADRVLATCARNYPLGGSQPLGGGACCLERPVCNAASAEQSAFAAGAMTQLPELASSSWDLQRVHTSPSRVARYED
jgi:hypothetical protein